jgi:hypothetical protein
LIERPAMILVSFWLECMEPFRLRSSSGQLPVPWA